MKRIGLIYPDKDPTSPKNWSGTPHGLATGLASLGFEVVPIPCILPLWHRGPIAVRSRLRKLGRTTFHRSAWDTWGRSRSISISIARAGKVDGIIAMGTDLYDLRFATQGTKTPIATYDDGTFALFLRYPDSDITASALPDEEVSRCIALQRLACRHADVACVSTSWAKRSVVDDFNVPDHRVLVVGMGHTPRLLGRSTRNFEAPRFLFVGVDWKRKNGTAVLEAFARVRAQIPNATLAVVGKHPQLEQPGVEGYGFLARENPVDQSLLDELFASATVFVLPSLFDPSPIAYLEAASAGLPVIATTCGGAGELLGDACLTVDPYDHDALYNAMMNLSDGILARSMGKLALLRSAKSRWVDVSERIAGRLTEWAQEKELAVS